jgi:hypothetical protein
MLTGALDCPFLIVPSVFPNIYLSSVFCIQCRQCLCIIHSWLSPRFSLMFICPMSCVLKVDSTSGLSILDRPLGFLLRLLGLCLVRSMLTLPMDGPFGFLERLFVLCLAYSMLPVSLHCPFLIAPSVFSIVYLSYVLCTQCWQDLWIVHSWLSIRFSLVFICPVSCVLNAASVSALSILDCPLGFL